MPTSTFLNLPQEKQERVLEAAVTEFGMRNVEEANLSNIVKSAAISRGSLYQYFPTKEDLYMYVFDTLRGRRAAYVEPAFSLYKKAPFLEFFQEFYLRDSEFLLKNPSHIQLGKQLYSCSNGVAKGLIQRLQTRYKEWFLLAIEFDKERNLISKKIDSASLADLCVHFVTDIFIFQSIYTQFSIVNIKEHCIKTLYIIKNGISCPESMG